MTELDMLKHVSLNRTRFLIHEGKHYKTISSGARLNNLILQQHLNGELSIGVFPDEEDTIFLVFDIDLFDYEILEKIISTLDSFEIKCDIVESGKKGFHVWVVFDQPIKRTVVDSIYELVLEESRLYSLRSKIEKRGGTNDTGIRLPHGIHPQTKAYTNFLERIGPSLFAPKDIISWSLNRYEDLQFIIDLTEESKKIVEELKIESPKSRTFKFETKIAQVKEILKAGKLLEKGSRNTATFLLALYFKDLGFSENETFEAIKNILLNTPEETFNDHVNPETRLTMLSHTISNVFIKEWSLGIRKIYKKDIAHILKLKNFNAIKVAFEHYRFSLISGGIYYLSHSKLSDWSGIPYGTIRHQNRKLQDLEYILLVQKGFKTYNGNVASEWAFLHVEGEGDFIETSIYDVDFLDITFKMFTDIEIRNLVGNSTFYKKFQKKMDEFKEIA